MTTLVIFLAALVLIGLGISMKRLGDRVVDELLALELRQIDRERKAAQYAANLAARWQG